MTGDAGDGRLRAEEAARERSEIQQRDAVRLSAAPLKAAPGDSTKAAVEPAPVPSS